MWWGKFWNLLLGLLGLTKNSKIPWLFPAESRCTVPNDFLENFEILNFEFWLSETLQKMAWFYCFSWLVTPSPWLKKILIFDCLKHSRMVKFYLFSVVREDQKNNKIIFLGCFDKIPWIFQVFQVFQSPNNPDYK